jgi:hypothetical protein
VNDPGPRVPACFDKKCRPCEPGKPYIWTARHNGKISGRYDDANEVRRLCSFELPLVIAIQDSRIETPAHFSRPETWAGAIAMLPQSVGDSFWLNQNIERYTWL